MKKIMRKYMLGNILRYSTECIKINFMEKNFQKTFNFMIVFLCFFSCGVDDTKVNTEPDSADPVLMLDPEEKEAIVTNNLFKAVLDNKSPKEFNNILSTSDVSILSVNEKGDTVLGTAIQFKKKELSLSLVDKFQCEELSHQNKAGESYIYLSSKHGYEKLIHYIASRCYENDMLDFSDYEFSKLDPETKNGEIAIHVALNGAVAETLNYEYDKGTLEYSWFPFYKKNNNGETFLHTAVKDDRVNTVEWAVRRYCHKGEWEESDSWWKQPLSAVAQHTWNGLQTYSVNVDQLINVQTNEGNTALHLAAHSLNIRNIELLSHCRWMDFLIENEDGNIALQVFLSALDPRIKEHSQAMKDSFVSLVHKETYVEKWLWFINISDTVNHQNKKEESSFHISARLAAPFFYNYLKQFADPYLRNREGRKPEEIFKATRDKLGNF